MREVVVLPLVPVIAAMGTRAAAPGGKSARVKKHVPHMTARGRMQLVVQRQVPTHDLGVEFDRLFRFMRRKTYMMDSSPLHICFPFTLYCKKRKRPTVSLQRFIFASKRNFS